MPTLKPLVDESYEPLTPRLSRRDRLIDRYLDALGDSMLPPKEALRYVLDSATTPYQYDDLKRGWMYYHDGDEVVAELRNNVQFVDSLPPRPTEVKIVTSIYDPSLLDGPRVAR